MRGRGFIYDGHLEAVPGHITEMSCCCGQHGLPHALAFLARFPTIPCGSGSFPVSCLVYRFSREVCNGLYYIFDINRGASSLIFGYLPEYEDCTLIPVMPQLILRFLVLFALYLTKPKLFKRLVPNMWTPVPITDFLPKLSVNV